VGEVLDHAGTLLPRAVPDAVAFVIARMPPATRTAFLRFADELDVRLGVAKGVDAGMSARAMLGLWGQEPGTAGRAPATCTAPGFRADFPAGRVLAAVAGRGGRG
jgi:hypothetical protein